MTLSPTRRSSLKALADGGLNFLDIEIDNLPVNSHLRGFLHNVVEGADKSISNILADKKILERAEKAMGTKYVAPTSEEAVEQPPELESHDQPRLVEVKTMPDRPTKAIHEPGSVFEI